MRTTILALALGFWSATVFGQTPADGSACGRLAASLKLPATTITLAQLVPAGAFVAPGSTPSGPGAPNFSDVPAFCRVAATIAPTSDSDIKVEVWMPAAGWNGKFHGVGNGGWAGSIQYAALAGAVKRGYAAASTDTGHVGGTAAFAVGHPEKLVDFAYRGVHEMAVQGKATTAAFYGRAPRYSYFTGCSNGGRQGFKEAQRFPGDFDGIASGAPAYNWSYQMGASIAIAQAALKDPANQLPAEKLKVLHQAVLNACDARDGVTDGVIDPERCTFDPKVVECKGADGPGCLTPAQVSTARLVYGESRDPAYAGLKPGSELAWTQLAGGPTPFKVGDDLFKYVVFKDPNWNFLTFNADRDIPLATKMDDGLINATDPNLKPFADRNGKLFVYHGWADQVLGSQHSVNYYKRVVAALGEEATNKTMRLFMAPGMTHCGGGEGPSTFDVVSVLEQWVEQGQAPDQVVASRYTEGKVDRTRPLCPYPQVAQYLGAGSTDDAKNFVCKRP